LRVKRLAAAAFRVVAVMEGEGCPTEEFLASIQGKLCASRDGLLEMLQFVAERGLAAMPHAWSHEVNKQESILEFIKGDLRLFYFRGKNGDIAVCSGGVVKKGRKADKSAVAKAIAHRNSYMEAVKNGTCQLIQDEDDETQQGA